MTNVARKFIDEAMSLTEEERLEVAFERLASVDGPVDVYWNDA